MKDVRDMTEPELKQWMESLLELNQSLSPTGIAGFMVIAFGEDYITHYASSIEREGAIQALRELADRLESGDTVER